MPGASLRGAALMQLKYEITIVRNRMVITLLTWWNWRERKQRGEEERRKVLVKRHFGWS